MHGKVAGGGVGIVAASDYVIATGKTHTFTCVDGKWVETVNATINTTDHYYEADKAQSPIDIRGAKTGAPAPIDFHYAASTADIVNNGHTVQVNLAEGGLVHLASGDYKLVQMHFHTPSEEKVNGKRYPLASLRRQRRKWRSRPPSAKSRPQSMRGARANVELGVDRGCQPADDLRELDARRVIHPLAAGVPVYLMTPAQFVQRLKDFERVMNAWYPTSTD